MSETDYSQGKSYCGSKNYQKAIESFQKCIVNHFNEERALLYICDCYVGLNNYIKLREYIDKIHQLNNQNTQISYYQGKCEFNSKKYEEAYKYFNEYIEKNRLNDDQNVTLYNCLYECRMEQGIYNSALEHIEYAAYFNITNETKILLTIKKIKAMNRLERYSDVLEIINNLDLKSQTEEIQLEFILQKAIALAFREIDIKSSNFFNECLNLCLDYSSKNNNFLFPMAICFFKQGDAKSGLEYIQSYLKIKPHSCEGHLLEGRMLVLLNKENDAYKSFTKAININPRSYNAHLEIANLLIKHNKSKRALDQIKSINPKQEETLVALLFLLKKAEINYMLKNNKDADIIMDQVGELLRVNDIEYKITPSILEQSLEQYFKLFHLKSGYNLNDFDKGTEQLGKGGFGIVTRGKLKNIDVAVKQYIIDPQLRKDNGMTKFFINCINEMKNHQDLEGHQNILKLITMFYVNDLIYIVTELCSGGNLNTLIYSNVELPFKRRIEILKQVADGLKYMHSFKKPYIHHDIKPLNILLVNKYDKNSNIKIKICDFGLTRNTWVYNTCGTPAYIPPELILSRNHSEKVDVYSFGITMWEMFTRTQPFKGIDERELAPRIINRLRPDTKLYESMTTNAITSLIEKCWDNEDNSRPSITDVYNKLSQML